MIEALVSSTYKLKIPDELIADIDSLPEDIFSMYRIYRIRKPKGGFRVISAPDDTLKSIQNRLLKVFEHILGPFISSYSTGFMKGKGVHANVAAHAGSSITVWCNKTSLIGKQQVKVLDLAKIDFDKIKRLRDTRKRPKYAVGIDIKKAFDYTTTWHLERTFDEYSIEISKEDLKRIYKVCFLRGCLPQGAPSSPILLEFILSCVDNAIVKTISKTFKGNMKLRYTYTRYADNLYLISDSKLVYKTISIAVSILKYYNYRVNNKKIKAMNESTGLFISGVNLINSFSHVSLSKKYRNDVRAEIFYASKEQDTKKRKDKIKRVIGLVSYISSYDSVHGLKLGLYAIEKGLIPVETCKKICKVSGSDNLVTKKGLESDQRKRFFSVE